MRTIVVGLVLVGLFASCSHAISSTEPGPRLNWTTLHRQQATRTWGYNFYLDTLTARRLADSSYVVWIIAEYDTVMTDESGTRYRALAGYQRIHCQRGTVIPLAVATFDETGTRVVKKQSDPDSAMAASYHFIAPPGSVVYQNLRQSCATLNHEPWRFDYD